MEWLSGMIWEDVVLTVGQLFFVVALWPMVFSPEKPPLATALAHGVILGSFAVAFISLELWLSAFSVTLVSAMWFYLGWQRWQQQSKVKM